MNKNIIRFKLMKSVFLKNIRTFFEDQKLIKLAVAYFRKIIFLRRMRKDNNCLFSHMAHSLNRATSRLQEVNRKVECFNNDFAWNKMKE